ncbi:MAG: Asp-tRNA(Asn)/Glu-tRNA(Gln) amidotransferase subunit GatC [Bacillota bacterium]|nr:Asp-tRNA(Asn)/Glu-tRNA(Gln) amidotransferase subunit GatC [Bacillota bacterium]
MTITREKMDDLAGLYQFELTDEEKDLLLKDFADLEEDLALFEAIDTEGVEPMVYPFEDETSYLREDDQIQVLALDQVLENAPERKDSYFVVPKVVE